MIDTVCRWHAPTFVPANVGLQVVVLQLYDIMRAALDCMVAFLEVPRMTR
jgi:hypothetical protein